MTGTICGPHCIGRRAEYEEVVLGWPAGLELGQMKAGATFCPMILVVDESDESAESIEHALTGIDGIVLRARSGPDALHAAINCGDELAVVVVALGPPGLIGSVGMVGMSISGCVELLRERPRFSTLPIVFVTERGTEPPAFRGSEGGPVECVFKPVDPHTLRFKVGAFVASRRQADQEARHARLLEQRGAGRAAELEATNRALHANIVERDAAEQAMVRDQAQRNEQLVEQARLATLGTTVATFAHEVGNLLNNMYLQAQLLERQLSRKAVVKPASLRLIMGEMQRLTILLDEFRELARRQDCELVETPLASVVAEALRVQMPTFETQRVKVIQELDEQDPTPVVMADRAKLIQALVNLCKNAVEAMVDGGTLTVSVNATGAEARVRICDTGVGIPNDIAVFEPFTTTKRYGTGLGLPVVREIVAAHAGTMCYESEVGVGTTFEIVLPLVSSASSSRVDANS
jgi:signal transduction histidine kinase